MTDVLTTTATVNLTSINPVIRGRFVTAPGRITTIPIPTPNSLLQGGLSQQDINRWANAVTVAIEKLREQIIAVASGGTSSSTTGTLYDNQGRVILDGNGLYVYDEGGGFVINANEVVIDTAQIANAAVVTSKIANLAVNTEKLAALAVQAANIASGAVTEDKVANLAITLGKIADGAVNTDKLAALAVTSGKLANGSVDTDKLAALAVEASKIAADAVTETKILNGSISTPKLQANAVTANEIAANTIVAANIAAGAIGATELAAASVVAGKLAANAIVAGDGVIANAAIGTALIANAAITTALIGDAQIVEAKIADLAVTDAKIANLTVSKLLAGTIGVNNIFLGSSRVHLDGINERIDFSDAQGTPQLRVRLGKLGAGSTDYGIQVYDSSGSLVFGQTTQAADILNTSQDWADIIGSGKPYDNADVTSTAGLVLVENHSFEQGDVKWTKQAGWTIINNPSNAYQGNWVASFTGTTGALRNSIHVPCEAGQSFLVEGRIKGVSGADGAASVRIAWLDETESEISTLTGNTVTSDGTYKVSRGVLTAPSGAFFARMEFVVIGSTTGTWYADQGQLFKIQNESEINALNTLNGPAQAGADVTSDSSFVWVANPSFERGDIDWPNKFGTWEIVEDAANARTGTWVGRAINQTGASSFRNSVRIPLEEGDRILVTGWVKASAGATFAGRAHIRWKDATDTDIGSSDGNDVTSTTYTQSRVVGVAPAGTVAAQIAFSASGAGTGTVWVDDLACTLFPRDVRDFNEAEGRQLLTSNQGIVFSETFEGTITEINADWETLGGPGERSVYTALTLSGGQALQIGNNSGNDQAWLVHKRLIPFDRDLLYEIQAPVRKLAGAGIVYVGWVGVAADGVTYVNASGANTISGQHYHCVSGGNPGTGYTTYRGYTKGFGATSGTSGQGAISSPGVMHPDVRYLRLMVLANYQDQTGLTIVDSVKVKAFAADGSVVRDGNPISSSNIATYMQTAAIQTAYIANAAITNALIANAAVDTAKIADLAVETLKIQDNAVTVPVSSFSASEVILQSTSVGTNITIQSATISVSGQPISITFSMNKTYGGDTQWNIDNKFEFRVYRDSTLLATYTLPKFSDSWGPTSLSIADTPSSGTYTYSVKAYVTQINNQFGVDSIGFDSRAALLIEAKK